MEIKLLHRPEINPSTVIIIKIDQHSDTKRLSLEKLGQVIPDTEFKISTGKNFILDRFITGRCIRERKYHAFLSCNDIDKDVDRKTIDSVYRWLNDVASVPI